MVRPRCRHIRPLRLPKYRARSALTHEVPAVILPNELGAAEAGGVAGYGPRFIGITRQLVKILRGAKPADIPVLGQRAGHQSADHKGDQALGAAGAARRCADHRTTLRMFRRAVLGRDALGRGRRTGKAFRLGILDRGPRPDHGHNATIDIPSACAAARRCVS